MLKFYFLLRYQKFFVARIDEKLGKSLKRFIENKITQNIEVYEFLERIMWQGIN